MDPEELMEVEIARLRELHAAGAISEPELRSGIEEARLGAGLPPVDEDPRQAAGGGVSRTPIILAFIAVDIVIVIAVLAFLLAD